MWLWSISWHVAGTQSSSIILLPIPDWDTTVYGGIGTDWHQHQIFDVGIALGVSEGGTFRNSVKKISLWGKHNSRLALNTTYPEIDNASFNNHNWFDFYGNSKEAIPLNMQEPREKDIDVRMYVDSNHTGEKSTRRSRMGFLIYTDVALIQWLYKKQLTIETSVFGAESMAIRHRMKTLQRLRYKLSMVGVLISGPSYINREKMSVIHNTQRT